MLGRETASRPSPSLISWGPSIPSFLTSLFFSRKGDLKHHVTRKHPDHPGLPLSIGRDRSSKDGKTFRYAAVGRWEMGRTEIIQYSMYGGGGWGSRVEPRRFNLDPYSVPLTSLPPSHHSLHHSPPYSQMPLPHLPFGL